MSNKEIELNKKLVEYEYYKQILNGYQTHFASLTTMLNEIENTVQSFEELKKIKEKNEEMFSLTGSNTFIPVVYNPSKKILIGIGAKIFVEYTVEQAIDFLSRKKEKIIEAMENTNKVIQELTSALNKLEKEIAKINEEIRKSK